MGQFQHLSKPFFFRATKQCDSRPVISTTNHRTQRDEENLGAGARYLLGDDPQDGVMETLTLASE